MAREDDVRPLLWVFFERHAVGGEYSAGYKLTGKGKLTTTFVPEGSNEAVTVGGGP